MRKTKIVCTIGPVSESKDKLKELINAGMNVARINFSHGGIEEQQEKINNIKEIREELNVPIALMMDTEGPEIRIGKFENSKIFLHNGAEFILTGRDVVGNENVVSISYKNLHNEINIGRKILINDGNIEIQVEKIENEDICCRVVDGGELSNRKSINIPGLNINLPILTQRDLNNIKSGIRDGFDYIAASFIRRKEDIETIRNVLNENDAKNIKIIAKIENQEGVDNFDEILNAADGIMVARGDLSVEIPMEQVPMLQKQFIKKCYMVGKPVITATQMLESMISNPRPTRAEVSDVANAIYDLTGAIMLSSETATGNFPCDCVETMDRIARISEESIKYWKRFKNRNYDDLVKNYEFDINQTICNIAMNMKAKAIFAFTEKGDTPRCISGLAPECIVYAFTSNEHTYRHLSLSWGIEPILLKGKDSIGDMLQEAIDIKKHEGVLQKGDIIIIAGGENILENNKGFDLNKIIGGVVKI